MIRTIGIDAKGGPSTKGRKKENALFKWVAFSLSITLRSLSTKYSPAEDRVEGNSHCSNLNIPTAISVESFCRNPNHKGILTVTFRPQDGCTGGYPRQLSALLFLQLLNDPPTSWEKKHSKKEQNSSFLNSFENKLLCRQIWALQEFRGRERTAASLHALSPSIHT